MTDVPVRAVMSMSTRIPVAPFAKISGNDPLAVLTADGALMNQAVVTCPNFAMMMGPFELFCSYRLTG